ncbi:hypothetical protein M1O15_20515 [Streptomyces lichenis]|uniref:Integral membrane protein n=1 Tax=Streptomyces lichenis TaxID=2306967 RepID=A0ABT0IEH5_9ACTN|nr:hypothetical protein [Streptomyces lichenis]
MNGRRAHGRLRAFARREWGPLVGVVRSGLRERGWRALPLSLGAVALTALCHAVQHQAFGDWGHGLVRAAGAVQAQDPLWLSLLRTPLSLFVPALHLPVWGALAQVLLVFGLAELTLGRWRTVLVAYAATLAGTLYARLGIALGPGSPLGLPASDARVVDTGPSAAVLGLAVVVCWRFGARVTGGLVVLAMVIEVAILPNLAGREHLAAIAAVSAGCAVAARRQRRRSSPEEGSSGGSDDGPRPEPGGSPESAGGSDGGLGGSGGGLCSEVAAVGSSSVGRPATRSPKRRPMASQRRSWW